MSVDNTSSNRAADYDAGVRVVLPYYDSINDEIMERYGYTIEIVDEPQGA